MSNLMPNLVRDNNPYNLRNRNNIAIPRVRLSVLQNSFFPATISLWNNLSENTRNMPTFNSFKRSLEPLNRHSFNNGRILERKYEVILARLKYSCGSLNADLHRVNFVNNSPVCVCSLEHETLEHYFFRCPQFHNQRAVLLQTFAPFLPLNIHFLLTGENVPNLIAIKDYIQNTKRFF